MLRGINSIDIQNELRRSVVIADDDYAVRLLLRLVLQQAGYEVVAEAGNGDDAVSAVAKHRPDVVVLDEEMPRMSGSQAARRIRSGNPTVKIIICSNSLRERPSEADASVPKEDVSYLPLTLDRMVR